MGTSVTATCPCGKNTEIMIGGGMNNFTKTCYFPCFCGNCHAVVQANLLDEQIKCPHCKTNKIIPYDDPKLAGKAGKNIVESWNVEKQLGRKLILTDGKYRCPHCDQITLRFMSGDVLWD
jgi:Zn finger protein HypA/HybF involved in hydrogenase expression